MNTKFVTKAKFKTEESYRVACKIQQRRLQILVHSYIYYELDDNIVSDSQWSSWAKELCIISKAYPDIAEKVIYADQFEDFDGSTGMDFTYDKWIENKAKLLLNCQRK